MGGPCSGFQGYAPQADLLMELSSWELGYPAPDFWFSFPVIMAPFFNLGRSTDPHKKKEFTSISVTKQLLSLLGSLQTETDASYAAVRYGY